MGVLVLVVGPSGAGKDSLIAGAQEKLTGDRRFVFPRRVVTRQATAHEDHDTLSAEQFAAELGRHSFALHWQAHGLSYGLRRETCDQVAVGRFVVCNVSRAVVSSARERFGAVAAVYVDAQPELRAARIAARGRDTATGSRIDPARGEVPPGDCEFTIDNSGVLSEAVGAFTDVLLAIAGERPHR